MPEEPFSIAELATGVLRVVDDVLTERGQPRGPFFYAGVSVGGAVGLQLLLDSPDRVAAAALLGTGARIGTEDLWAERIGQVGVSGTGAMVDGAAERWFGPGFVEREPERASALLQALSQTADDGYLQVCGALAAYDVRAQLGRVAAPVLAVAGSVDIATPPPSLREIADGVRDGRYAELDGVAHLSPAEAPEVVAGLLREHFLGETPGADDAVTDFTRDLEALATTYAWEEVWSRPGLDRRSRSVATLTALIARGHHDELAVHVRAALRTGLSVAEIREVILQSALYCGFPEAHAAYRVAAGVLAEEGLP